MVAFGGSKQNNQTKGGDNKNVGSSPFIQHLLLLFCVLLLLSFSTADSFKDNKDDN
jgi:hypothetical protein